MWKDINWITHPKQKLTLETDLVATRSKSKKTLIHRKSFCTIN